MGESGGYDSKINKSCRRLPGYDNVVSVKSKMVEKTWQRKNTCYSKGIFGSRKRIEALGKGSHGYACSGPDENSKQGKHNAEHLMHGDRASGDDDNPDNFASQTEYSSPGNLFMQDKTGEKSNQNRVGRVDHGRNGRAGNFCAD